MHLGARAWALFQLPAVDLENTAGPTQALSTDHSKMVTYKIPFPKVLLDFSSTEPSHIRAAESLTDRIVQARPCMDEALGG